MLFSVNQKLRAYRAKHEKVCAYLLRAILVDRHLILFDANSVTV